MNIRQFIQTQKENHNSRRSQQIQDAMQENKLKLKRAEEELAYRKQKEKLRQTREESHKLKTQPIRKLQGQAKNIMNTIQNRPQRKSVWRE